MKTRIKTCLLPALLAAGLTACATPAPSLYAPSGGGDRGYTQTRIETDRYRVRFSAGHDMDMRTVEDLALRRAAEITQRDGGDWFLVVNRVREGEDADPVDIATSVGVAFGSGGYRSTSLGLGVQYDPSAGDKSVMLEILVRSGERPDAETRAYSAEQVLGFTERAAGTSY